VDSELLLFFATFAASSWSSSSRLRLFCPALAMVACTVRVRVSSLGGVRCQVGKKDDGDGVLKRRQN
jgi:hypothetical protein